MSASSACRVLDEVVEAVSLFEPFAAPVTAGHPTRARPATAGAHADYGIITLLLADDVPGLRIHRDGAWHHVVVPPGALLGNIGDLLAQWTNDRWRSTLHRVVPPAGASSGDPVRRRSVARFLDCEPDMLIECTAG